MQDAALLGRLQRRGDRRADAQRLLYGQRKLRDPDGQRLSFELLHDEGADVALRADVVEGADVRMIEAGNGARLALLARPQSGIPVGPGRPP